MMGHASDAAFDAEVDLLIAEKQRDDYERSMEILRPYMEHHPKRTVAEAMAMIAAGVEPD